MMRKIIVRAALGVIVLLAAAQFVQPNRTNPPVDPAATFEAVAKPPAPVAAFVNRSCRDCHSNSTVWPWYSHVSPVSWLVAVDVKNGRNKLNFSNWSIYGPEMSQLRLRDACEEVRSGKMPLGQYLLIHPDAKPVPQEVDALCASAE